MSAFSEQERIVADARAKMLPGRNGGVPIYSGRPSLA